MDIGNSHEPETRWAAGLRSLARRISSAMPASVAGRMKMVLACLLAAGLLGGLRIGESEIWLAPPPGALVLAAMILGALNRHKAVVLKRLLHSSRSAVDPYGLFVILMIVFASAQAIHVVIPAGTSRWLVYLLFSLPLLALNTPLTTVDHARIWRYLVAIFGAAFAMTFVVLPSIPLAGMRDLMCRILPGCQPLHPAAGYLAFLTLLLYLSALAGLSRTTRGVSERLA